ncbi:transposase [Trichocoleus sp. FACHB-262]|uniref:transposase n=1 Tax=Trichocoleus sp. FACHB-262 TaxID=2692869 RepID=UPI0037DDBDF6
MTTHGKTTKIHLPCEGNGKPVTFRLTVEQCNESVVFESLMEQGKVKRVGCGRPCLRPQRVAADKAYTGHPIRSYLQRRGIGAVIPRRSNESRQGTRFDRQAYRDAIALNEPSIASSSFDALPPAMKNGQRIIAVAIRVRTQLP